VRSVLATSGHVMTGAVITGSVIAARGAMSGGRIAAVPIIVTPKHWSMARMRAGTVLYLTS
jgi:hypothetical protein